MSRTNALTRNRPRPLRSRLHALVHRRARGALAIGVLAFAPACAHVDIETPDGFAELDANARQARASGYEYRATNAEGVVLAVRHESNDPRGDLSFWSGAVDAHLRRAGYQAVSGADVESEDGIAGRQIRYTIEHSGRPHVFWATVFVTERAVVTVEVGGDAQWFEDQVDAVDAAIASLALG